jgi:hypothetical protein
MSSGEFFTAMFEHVESFITGSSYQVEPELEMALDKLNNLKQTMQQLVANPPQATK